MTITNQKPCRIKRRMLKATLFLSAIVAFSSMSFAHNTSGGCAKTADVSISSNQNWITLCSKTLTLTDGTHNCVVTASADVTNPFAGTDNLYRFTVDTLSNPVTNSAQERTIELNGNPGISDPDKEVVSTVRNFNLESGTYTFFWLARRVNANDAITSVDDNSMGVTCTDGN
jgi:hypothetical protein